MYAFDSVGDGPPLIAIGLPPVPTTTGTARSLPAGLQQFHSDLRDGIEANVAVGGIGVSASTELSEATEVAGFFNETLDYRAEPVPYEPRVADVIATWIDPGSGLYSFVDVSRSNQSCWRCAGGILDAVVAPLHPEVQRSTRSSEHCFPSRLVGGHG